MFLFFKYNLGHESWISKIFKKLPPDNTNLWFTITKSTSYNQKRHNFLMMPTKWLMFPIPTLLPIQIHFCIRIAISFWVFGKLTAKESRLHKFSQKYFTLRVNSHNFYLSWIYTNLKQYYNICKRFFDEKGKVKCFTSFFIFFKSQCIYLQYSLNMSNYVQIV